VTLARRQVHGRRRISAEDETRGADPHFITIMERVRGLRWNTFAAQNNAICRAQVFDKKIASVLSNTSMLTADTAIGQTDTIFRATPQNNLVRQRKTLTAVKTLEHF
jgi:hypothetical protein